MILGITPGTAEGFNNGLPRINSIIAAYAAENNIQLVNYGDALCQCVGALGQPTEGPNNFQQLVNTIRALPSSTPGPYIPTLLPTTAGYALMTQLAETAVANEYLTIQSGWLSDLAMPNSTLGLLGGNLSNLNTAPPAAILQFTPIGYHSDNSQHTQSNTTWDGANGTWTSSNPLVMSVSQQGLAVATTPGTATIKYTQASGVDFHSWVMTVAIQ